MRQNGFCVNYIDDYIGINSPDVASKPFVFLTKLMQQLGLTISGKKLVSRATCVISLGVLIDSVQGTISIPVDKLKQSIDTVQVWLVKMFAPNVSYSQFWDCC